MQPCFKIWHFSLFLSNELRDDAAPAVMSENKGKKSKNVSDFF